MNFNILIILFFLISFNNGLSQENLFPHPKTIKSITEIDDLSKTKDFTFIIYDSISSIKHNNRTYYKTKVSYFGEFYLALEKDTIYSLVSNNEKTVFSEHIVFIFGKKKQNLGYPFLNHSCFQSNSKNGIEKYTCIETFSQYYELTPFEIRSLFISKASGFNRLILREKKEEKFYYTN